MQIRQFYETDGKCFAKTADGCSALNGIHPKCGTYLCKWYKPQSCQDWIRIDWNHMVRLYAPEEVMYDEDR